jgi:transposase
LAAIDATLMQQHKANPLSRRLAAIPGIGPIGALNFALRVAPGQFASARHFAAWLGLVPRECSTAGQGPTDRSATSPWLLNLLGRKPRKLAAVALANKMARIVWAMMTSGEAYRPRPAAA